MSSFPLFFYYDLCGHVAYKKIFKLLYLYLGSIVSITRPIGGVEGDTPSVFCFTSGVHSLIEGENLFLQVGIVPLSGARATIIATNDTHKEFRLRSLNRANFTNLDGDGDNGMPLNCAFMEIHSEVALVTVYCKLKEVNCSTL